MNLQFSVLNSCETIMTIMGQNNNNNNNNNKTASQTESNNVVIQQSYDFVNHITKSVQLTEIAVSGLELFIQNRLHTSPQPKGARYSNMTFFTSYRHSYTLYSCPQQRTYCRCHQSVSKYVTITSERRCVSEREKCRNDSACVPCRHATQFAYLVGT
jgi:hypothetical protein